MRKQAKELSGKVRGSEPCGVETPTTTIPLIPGPNTHSRSIRAFTLGGELSCPRAPKLGGMLARPGKFQLPSASWRLACDSRRNDQVAGRHWVSWGCQPHDIHSHVTNGYQLGSTGNRGPKTGEAEAEMLSRRFSSSLKQVGFLGAVLGARFFT